MFSLTYLWNLLYFYFRISGAAPALLRHWPCTCPWLERNRQVRHRSETSCPGPTRNDKCSCWRCAAEPPELHPSLHRLCNKSSTSTALNMFIMSCILRFPNSYEFLSATWLRFWLQLTSFTWPRWLLIFAGCKSQVLLWISNGFNKSRMIDWF